MRQRAWLDDFHGPRKAGLIQVTDLAETANSELRYALQKTQLPGGNSGQGVEGAPLLPHAELPLRAVYFPLGFPLEVFSNSSTVMTAADRSWKHFQPKFTDPPLELRIQVVDDREGVALPPAPACTMQWNILLHVADARNFLVCDLRNGRSFGSITQMTAESSLYLRYYFLEGAVLSMMTALRAAPIHAACISTLGSGMLLCGDSGAGKTSLAYAGARSGWIFVSDDASYLPLGRKDRLVVGNHYQIRFRNLAVELFPELKRHPVTPRVAGKPSIEVPTSELTGLVTSDSATIEYVIFLNRYASEDALTVLSKDYALEWFKQWCYTAPDEVQKIQHAALEHLLTVPIYELRYRDPGWAVQRLERLAAMGR